MASVQKIRFGVLGTSRIAQKSVLPALVDSPHAELVAIGSRTPESARTLADTFSCATGTYEEVLARKDIDAVYISLPNALHATWVKKAAEAGKHIWCEKPATTSFEEAKEMVAACRTHNVRLIEGFTFLFHPQHARVLELIHAGTLGMLSTFEGSFSYPTPPAGNIRLNATLGGGVYADAAVYPIRASRMLFDAEPESVLCTLLMDDALGVDTKANLILKYPGGQTAHVSVAFDTNFQSTYSLLGSIAKVAVLRAYAVPKDMPVTLALSHNDTTEEIIIPAAGQFSLLLEDFCKEIALGEHSTKKYEEDLLAQARIVEAGLRSHKEARTVLLSEIK